jgi:hypothetical protein
VLPEPDTLLRQSDLAPDIASESVIEEPDRAAGVMLAVSGATPMLRIAALFRRRMLV